RLSLFSGGREWQTESENVLHSRYTRILCGPSPEYAGYCYNKITPDQLGGHTGIFCPLFWGRSLPSETDYQRRCCPIFVDSKPASSSDTKDRSENLDP